MCAAIVTLGATAAPAAAQWRAGVFVGGEHESSWDKFLVVGADVRGPVTRFNIEINPRFSYFLRDDLTRYQVDLNIIKPLLLASKSRIVPYVGTGIAMENVNYDDPSAPDQSKIGFNYIVGSTFSTAGRLQPFAQFEYTVLNESANNAVISVGLHFKFAGSK